jgi:hypothetical protein
VSDHEDVLRRLKAVADGVPYENTYVLMNLRQDIRAVLAEVESLRAERDDLRVEIVEAKESLRKAGSIGAGYLTRVERLEKALRRVAEDYEASLINRGMPVKSNEALRLVREALAPSAPEPASASLMPTTVGTAAEVQREREVRMEISATKRAVRSCPTCGIVATCSAPWRGTMHPLGRCSGWEPAPAPTERVCRERGKWISCPERECAVWEDHEDHACGHGKCAKWVPPSDEVEE